jgi:hypothetical protein
MDSSFREQESGTQETPKSFLAGLKILTSLITWLAGLIKLTEEEREDVGIYLGRPGPGGE